MTWLKQYLMMRLSLRSREMGTTMSGELDFFQQQQQQQRFLYSNIPCSLSSKMMQQKTGDNDRESGEFRGYSGEYYYTCTYFFITIAQVDYHRTDIG
jgi:hypothetical protein